MNQFKPMLASATEPRDLRALRYPLLVSPKLDGIRAVTHATLGPVSRNLKPIANHRIREWMLSLPAWMDGELVAGSPTAPDCFRRTSSIVMSAEHPDWREVEFWVFDCAHYRNLHFEHRLHQARELLAHPAAPVLPHIMVHTVQELEDTEGRWVSEGYEGVMLRDPRGPYKCGRSTPREGWLLKLKRFEDCEAEVLGWYEQQHNGNAPTVDALGRTKRSSHKAGKTGKDTLGGLRVRALNGAYKGAEFEVGTGFDDAMREALWAQRDSRTNPLAGRIAKVKYFPTGSKQKPRFPVWLGWRYKNDMS